MSHPWRKPFNSTEQRAMTKGRWKAENPDKVRDYDRKRNGLPEPTRPCPEVCECCGQPPGVKAMHLDHDHATGAFRGWLCGKCNTAIGMLGDSAAGVQRALNYLTNASATNRVPAI